MKKILNFLDICIRKYLGIDQQELIPQTIKKVGNTFLLVNTESNKRHIYTENVTQFLSDKLDQLGEPAKEKLGISLGKAMANNLLVSFDRVNIKVDN